jgi:hypothetical protein
MAKATNTPTVTVSPVDTLIIAAGKAAGTMYSKTIEAANLAKSELDGSKPLAERIATVMTAHADAFKTAGHNVRAIFSDALTLHACAGTQVVVLGPNKSQQTMSAARAATTLAKNPMREAAKDVRAEHGIGRKTTPKVVASSVAPKATSESMASNTLAEVADLIVNTDFVARLTALLDIAGYVMAPKATTKLPIKPIKPVAMASLPVHRVAGVAGSAPL